ncbi:MAG: efflux RND transporter periplasmic adaptor subunit [Planctomycetes bacterium]|nr:efflux RND transporter periplasmic adaptor subunit [Planctomycetota bacterium]
MAQNSKLPGNGELPPRPAGEVIRLFFWKMLPWVVLLSILVLLIVFLTYFILVKEEEIQEVRDQEASNKTVVSMNVVVWEVVEKKELIQDIKLPGIIQPWENLTLQAQVAGRIVEFLKDEGDTVKEGEVIARIDDRDYKASLANTEAALVLAEQNLKRTRGLSKQGAIPQADLDTAEANARQAASTVDLAKLQLERCTITAPFGGTINRRYITLGTLVSAGENIVELLDTRKVKVEIGIPESDVDRVRKLQTTEVTVDALDGRKFTGEKIFLSQKPIVGAQVFDLRLAIDNSEQLLRPGMFVEARIVLNRKENTIFIPLYTVIARGEDRFCMVAEGDKAVRRPVELGIMKGLGVEILSGLQVGDQLIVHSQRQVEDGEEITIIRSIKDPNELNP